MGFNPDYEVVFGPDGKIIPSQLPASADPVGMLRLPNFVAGAWYETQFKGVTISTASPTLNTVHYDLIYVPNAITASALAARAGGTNASMVFNLGIYAAGSNGGPPAARLASGTVAAPAAGTYQVTGLGLALTPGFYYLAFLATGAVATVAVANGAPNFPHRGHSTPIVSTSIGAPGGYMQTGQSSLPSTATPVEATDTQQARPRVAMLAA